MIKLKKVTLENFKVFDGNAYSINFNDNNLILLDGPNGYGKTSVFDAIELGLTGNISRLTSLENRQNPTDVVVAHNGANEVEVTLEFDDEEGKTKVFRRKLKNKIPNSSKKISKFTELWELYEIIEGNAIPLSESDLNKYFCSNDFSRDFLLFHYVQQEETSRFLKNNTEVQRAEELARLFGNTKDSEQNLNKLSGVLGKLSSAKRNISTQIDDIKKLYKIDNDVSTLIGGSESHFHIFPWLVETSDYPFWDASSIPEFNQEKLNIILQEVNSIKELVKYRNFFIRGRTIKIAASQKELISLYVGYFNAVSNYEFYMEKQISYEFVKSSLEALQSLDIERIKNNVNFEKLFSILSIEELVIFETALSMLEKENNKSKGLSTVYSEIIKHHDVMSKYVHHLPEESSCLLCGHDYQTHSSLTHAISENAKLIRTELSDQEKLLVQSRDLFNKNHLQPLIKICSAYITQQVCFSSEDLIELNKANSTKSRFEKLRNWLDSEGIEHEDLLIHDYPINGQQINLNSVAEVLMSRILALISNVPESYYEADGDGVFERIYREYFNSNQEFLLKIDIQNLEKKERYIKGLYFDSLRIVIDELKVLKDRMDDIERAFNDVSDIIDIVRSQIRRYRKRLITDIEIPFYIYSGKILQTHQAGIGKGIFIKDPTGEDELKNVRFVSNWNSDHDVINTMSSGQISTIVIALTLAINKTYCNALSSIFIDDPVQTMDDINMTSLIELLRNDFKGKQLILSTHEDKVSRYFTYKYLKHGENVKIVNLMQRKEYIPGNNYIYRKMK
ncbi:AAA family ATPase [Dickeya lacustris]|uniref:AAA family ATPase n=1 Tax=Dickeya lacustris TaxID=2259638 RepID=A0ABY8GBF1_9GAMM|nr:AAA family ATPase [Dickeya lacustris]WFN57297.1 AAA family ATPase [Dickeya lacustris]